ncbi:SoxY-related AACIE arm protein [Polaromonas sp.]|uniref:SoxY-related AACIE arm protein n=1 Tax=Polaromonas sp. TaxID=1869339 RepID=UPI0032650170
MQASSPPTAAPAPFTRRQLLAGAGGVGLCVVLRPAIAATGDLAVAIRTYTGGAQIRSGKVTLDVAELVDNGNVVPITVAVDSPMTATDYVKSIAVFNEKNPQRDVARFAFTPRSGKASATARIRLATSQQLVAIAQLSDGSYWSHTVDVIVTLAACIETE